MLTSGLLAAACGRGGLYQATSVDGSTCGRDAAKPTDDVGPDQVGMLELVAGKLGGHGYRDGIGDTARFDSPEGVTTDGMGTLFISDTRNHAIRKMVIASREVTTLAGSPGDRGSDDGAGTSARFDYPRAITYDGAGNLFVADSFNKTIRQVVIATGAVTTLAGADGRFRQPAALAYDGAGNLFVGDTGTLHRVVVATGDVTIVAGRFEGISALACDEAGNVFVAEPGTSTIYQVVAATGAVTMLAGNLDDRGDADDATSNWLEDMVYDGAGSLIVTETEEPRIRQVAIATGEVTTFMRMADADRTCPWGSLTYDRDGTPRYFDQLYVASDGAGKLYVIAADNDTICEIAVATKTVTKVAGTTSGYGAADGIGAEARFCQLKGMASDGAGNLFIADSCNGSIRKLRVASSEVSTLAGQACFTACIPQDGVGADARFSDPLGVASDRKGNLFVTDGSGHTIRKIVVDTGVVTTLAGSPWELGHQDGTGADARFTRPTGIACDGADSLFVTEEGNRNIRKVDTATGAVTTLVLSSPHSADRDGSVTAEIVHPAGLACDGAGHLFVGDSGNCALYKVDLATMAVTLLAGSPGECGDTDGTGTAARFHGLQYMTHDGAGDLYVSGHTIRKVSLATGTVTTVVGSPGSMAVGLGSLPAQLHSPAGLAFVPGSGLFIADAAEPALLLARF